MRATVCISTSTPHREFNQCCSIHNLSCAYFLSCLVVLCYNCHTRYLTQIKCQKKTNQTCYWEDLSILTPFVVFKSNSGCLVVNFVINVLKPPAPSCSTLKNNIFSHCFWLAGLRCEIHFLRKPTVFGSRKGINIT